MPAPYMTSLRSRELSYSSVGSNDDVNRKTKDLYSSVPEGLSTEDLGKSSNNREKVGLTDNGINLATNSGSPMTLVAYSNMIDWQCVIFN